MNKIYGYCRISRKEQNIDRQERNIKAAYPEAIILKEAFTGTKVEGRTQFEKLMRTAKSGDTIVFDSVSRMSRNADEGIKQYMIWFDMGVSLVFLKEQQISTETYKQALETELSAVSTGDQDTDEFIDAMFKAVSQYMKRLQTKQIRIAFEQAEKEVADLHQRTKEGIETARINGKQIGQKAGNKLTVKKAVAAKEIIKTHSRDFGGTLNDAECQKLAGISRNSFYKYKRELTEEING